MGMTQGYQLNQILATAQTQRENSPFLFKLQRRMWFVCLSVVKTEFLPDYMNLDAYTCVYMCLQAFACFES